MHFEPALPPRTEPLIFI